MTNDEKRASELRMQLVKINAEVQELDKKIKEDKHKLYNSMISKCFSFTNTKTVETHYFKILCLSLEESPSFIILKVFPDDFSKMDYELEHDIRNLDTYLEPDHFGISFRATDCDSFLTTLNKPSPYQFFKEISLEDFNKKLSETQEKFYEVVNRDFF